MKKIKTITKTAIVALALLLTFALSFALTSAWYNARKQASGTIIMPNGIVIDYSGFNQGTGTWGDSSATFLLFADQNNALPGTNINLNNAAIKAGTNSADFYARVKLEYKFFTDVAGTNNVTTQIADYSAFLNTPAFSNSFVNSNKNDGWFYYGSGTTFSVFPDNSYVDIFAASQSITLNGEAEGFDHDGGGYKYSNEILIKRVEVYLTIETLQATADAVAAHSWEIVTPPPVENESHQVIQINSNEITLGNAGGPTKLGTGEAGSLDYDVNTLGNTLKIVVAGNSQINANAFKNSGLEEIYIGDQEYINGVSSYSAKIYTTPATFTIGANAFAGCTNLKLYLASGVNYTIYTNAVPSTATVYYNGNQISLPSSAGAVAETGITMLLPPIATGGSGGGSVAVSVEPSKGNYTYEDINGNIYYFNVGNLGSYSIQGNESYPMWITINDSASTAAITAIELADNTTLGQNISIPSVVRADELVGEITVVGIDGSWNRLFVNEVDPYAIASVTIPDTVLCINGSMFIGTRDYVEYNSITVNLPNSLICIGDYVFDEIGTSISPITIPNSVKYIGKNAFSHYRYTSITLPNQLEFIGDNAFSGSSITAISLPNTLKVIGYGAFSNSIFTSVTLPSNIESIKDGAFSGCSNLISFSISNNAYYSVSNDGRCLIKNGGDNHELIAFAPSGITSYSLIPDTVTIISNVFSGLQNLQSITIPDSVYYVGSFSGCRNLQSVTFGSSVEYISSFNGCTSLTSIELPSNLIRIDSSSFSNSGLTSITIPNSVEEIGVNAFGNCDALETVIFEGSGRTKNLTISEYAFQYCSNLATVNFNNWPSGVYVTVGDEAFANCKDGLVVNIPNQE